MLDIFACITDAITKLFGSESFWLAVTLALLIGIPFKPLSRGWKVAMRVYSAKVENEITDAAVMRKEAELLLARHNQVLDGTRGEIEKMKKQAAADIQHLKLNTAKTCEELSAAAARQVKEQVEFMRHNMLRQVTADLNLMVSMTLENVLARTALKRTHQAEYKNIIHALERKN